MKKFSKIIKESKDLSYNTIFGKSVSHDQELKNRIISYIVDILMEENGVSEKSYSKVDEIVTNVKNVFTEELFIETQSLYNQNKRLKFIAEILYDKYYTK
jgi:hypothetical protein